MSKWYPYIKKHYDEGRYEKEQVYIFVRAKMITEEEYLRVTE